MEQPIMPYEKQEDLVESFDHHRPSDISWYTCSACRDYIEYLAQVYGTEKIEYIINAYESGLLETKYTRDKDSRYGYHFPLYMLGDRVKDLFLIKD